MLDGAEPREATDSTPDAFGRCPRCSMQVRREELSVHLAHAHNVGPAVKNEKGKDRRNKRRPGSDD